MKIIIYKMKRCPILSLLSFGIIFNFLISILYCAMTAINGEYIGVEDIRIVFFIFNIFITFPVILSILTIINIIALFWVFKNIEWQKALKKFEYITIVMGAIYTFFYISVSNIIFDGEWSQTLYNNEIHQPVWTSAMPTIFVLCIIGILGYLLLSLVNLRKTPPLILVLAISAMYLGIFECIMWCVQVLSKEYWILCVFPLNCIIIFINTIRNKIIEWNLVGQHKYNFFLEMPILNYINNRIYKAELWPFIAFILMWPLLGIILCIFILFGQKPDYILKAWTETAEWRLSKRTAPRNFF